MDSPSEPTRRSAADVLYDAFFSGAIGGSLVAIFFLFIDLARAEPLFTPSLMGSVLFAGADAARVSGVHLDMVALYTGFHFASFGALGLLASLVVHEVELHSKHPALLLGVLFVLFESAIALVAGAFMPGTMARVGVVYVAAANLLAAGGMGLFFMTAHQPAVWQRIKQAAQV
jgi:hypothetical protein